MMISVVIPMFNAERTIVAALDSIKNQTLGSQVFEVIVINDGSTDRSASLVKEYIQLNPEMKILLLNQENKGVSSARNAGLKTAKGDYIAFLDADDEWLPEKTEKQLAYFRNEKLKIDFITALRNDEKIWFPYTTNQNNIAKITLKKILLRVEGQTSTALFKRKVIDNTGYFDENQRYSEDANYWMKISKCNNMYILAEVLVYTGGGKKSYGEAGLSANLKEMEKGIQKNILEMYKTRRISTVEYVFYFVFSKIKYFLRIIKTKL